MANDLYYRVSIQAAKARYDASHDLSSLEIEEESSKATKLTMELSDPFKVFSHALQEGMQVEVDVGIASDHSIIFRGQIYTVEGSFPDQAVPTLRLVAYDRSLTMGLRRRNCVWTKTSLQGIVNTIAQAHSFSPRDVKVDLHGNPKFTENGIRQQDETDLAFLLRLATKYGCEMCVMAGNDSDQLFFRAQYSIMKSDPLITLYYGRSGVSNCLLSFQATTDVSKIQLPRVFSGIDFDQGKGIKNITSHIDAVGSTDDRFQQENQAEFRRRYPDMADSVAQLLSAARTVQQNLRKQLGNAENVVTLGFVTQEDLDTLADNQFSTSIHGMRASGSTIGNHRIHAQATIGIADVGGQFSGTWYVSQVRHVVNDDGYQTEFQCQR